MASIKRDYKSSMFCMLWENKAAAIAMSIFEYDQEAHMRLVRREGYEDGRMDGITQGMTQGKVEDIIELLADLGNIPLELQEKIYITKDLQQLKKWLKLASKVQSIEEFIKKM